MMIWLSVFFLQSSYALEPMDPKAMCEQRMVIANERKRCEQKADTLKLDWYAATACNALLDDKKFLSCWQSVAGGEFNPEALSRCVEGADDSDEEILKCIVSLKNKRMPASVRRPYQSLKIQKTKKVKPKNK